jgi:hypothetical protein
MIVDLVMYFLRQKEYNGEGDIAVLCAYLGQLQKVRAELRNLKVTVAVDERDEDQLVKQGLQEENEMPSIEEVSVSRRVRLLQRFWYLIPISAMIHRFGSVPSTFSKGKKQRLSSFL